MPAVGACSDSWSVKSKAALLLALVVKRQGQQLWQALQPQLLPLAQQGPVQAEMVGDSPAAACMQSLSYSVACLLLSEGRVTGNSKSCLTP